MSSRVVKSKSTQEFELNANAPSAPTQTPKSAHQTTSVESSTARAHSLVGGFLREAQSLFPHKRAYFNIYDNQIITGACTRYYYDVMAVMEFDSFGVDASRMQIITAREVKCLQRGSIRLKSALPTAKNNA